MKDLSVKDRNEFEAWRIKEEEYLKGLSHEPIAETMEMEYYQRLLKFRASQYVLSIR